MWVLCNKTDIFYRQLSIFSDICTNVNVLPQQLLQMNAVHTYFPKVKKIVEFLMRLSHNTVKWLWMVRFCQLHYIICTMNIAMARQIWRWYGGRKWLKANKSDVNMTVFKRGGGCQCWKKATSITFRQYLKEFTGTVSNLDSCSMCSLHTYVPHISAAITPILSVLWLLRTSVMPRVVYSNSIAINYFLGLILVLSSQRMERMGVIAAEMWGTCMCNRLVQCQHGTGLIRQRLCGHSVTAQSLMASWLPLYRDWFTHKMKIHEHLARSSWWIQKWRFLYSLCAPDLATDTILCWHSAVSGDW